MAKTFEFDAYLIMLCDPDYADFKAPQFADALGVKTTQIYKWNQQVNWDDIKASRRKAFSKRTIEVDSSLFKATKKGDVAAIRTWYERFDAWTPASKIQTEQIVSDAELDEAINGLLKLATPASVDVGTPAPTEDGANAVLPAEPSPTEVHQ